MLRSADKKLRGGRGLRFVVPHYRPPAAVTYGTSGASSGAVVINTSASANTKGSWTEIIASADFDADGFYVQNTAASGVERDSLFDVGIGGAGAEVEILANAHTMGDQDSNSGLTMYVPIPIAAGTRVSARAQASTGSSSIHLAITLVRGGFAEAMRLHRATTYGANTADSGGIGVDPGGVADTDGAWSEITSASTNPCKALMVFIGRRADNALSGTTLHRLDIGIGAGGSEAVIIPALHMRGGINNDHSAPHWHGPFPVDIPAGTRLAARARSSSTNATDRLLDAIVIGYD